jgi:tight adherence protein C
VKIVSELIIAQLDFVSLLPFAAFGAIAIAAWVAADMLFNRKTRSDQRLEQMKDRALGKSPDASSITLDGQGNKKEGFSKLLEAASPKLGDTLKPKSEREISKQREKLDSAGFRSESAPAMFNTLKMIMAIVGFVIGGGTNMLVFGLTINSFIYTLVCTGIFLMLPETIVGFIAKSRKEKVFLGLPDALDLMVVCVEAGLGLDQAMRKVAEELAGAHPVIAEEFDICNKQLQMGRKRDAVLTDLGDRNGVDDLKTLASIMIQVDRFGTSIGTALRTQSDTMRVRRRQIAEEKAAKTAVKLIFPLVLFIFPGIFVVLVGPAAITMVNEMLPALQK